MLTELQRRMLGSCQFHIDGWCSERAKRDADNLLDRGLVTCFEGGSRDAQYTSLNYTITDAGRAALDAS